ncbi:hypothetical protein THS5294_03627 [Thalassobacter stenotrophicus]|uniref:PLAT domain-containing protein n=2 Tax=Thalassobacter stenotrophicus TaxID=266809 RepID=A0A0P1F3Y1_9RHOB|nr:hypothetical protein THS5294_03627 [Thalassobacter stenotrophicus]SHI30578.1 hypothetical protein SAMN02744035_00002 [Thalassobacter stenotrophicus DSM 16310]
MWIATYYFDLIEIWFLVQISLQTLSSVPVAVFGCAKWRGR